MREHVTQSDAPGNAAASKPARSVQAHEALGRLLSRVLSEPYGYAGTAAKVTSGTLSRKNSGSTSVRSLLHLQRTRGNRYVQRVLALSRQGDDQSETTPEVESAIENARGGGQQLDGGTQRKMESSFGADFSGVRIHTGPDAHSLNRAVNAVAFTTGQDIFFRDGAYNPSGSEGQELLAHELTHVVQQGGASPIPGQAQRFEIHRLCSECQEEKDDKLQHKFALSQPGDEYEREADQVAKAVMGTPDTRSAAIDGNTDVISKPSHLGAAWGGPAKVLPSMLQREVTQPLKDGSITLGATAELFDGATRLDTVTFPKDAREVSFPKGLQQRDADSTFHGSIRLTVDASWRFEAESPGTKSQGQGQLVIDAPFRIPKAKGDDDTAVKTKQPRLIGQVSNGTGAALDPQPAMSADADDNGVSVTVSPRVTYQEQRAEAIQGGGGLSVGPLNVGVQGQTQSQLANTQAFGTSFTADLLVTKFQPPAPPQDHPYKCVRAGRLDQTGTPPGFGPFIIASDEFAKPDDARQEIHDWYFGLEPQVRQNLEEGKGILRVTGRASRSGSSTFNLALAEKRAKRVRGMIADFAGSDAHLNSFALGEFGAQTKDKKEDANERRVDVQIDGTVPGAQAVKMQGDDCAGHLGATTPTGPTGPVVNPPESSDSTPAVAGPQAAGPQTSGPQTADTLGGTAVASTGGGTPASAAGSQDFEEAQSGVGSTAAAAQEPTAQDQTAGQAVATEEQPAEETTA